MNTVATNILIAAQASQAMQTIQRVQRQLGALGTSARAAANGSNTQFFGDLERNAGSRITRTQQAMRGMMTTTLAGRNESNRPWFQSMTSAGSQMQWIGRQLTSNLTLPVVALTAAGINLGLKFQQSMTRLDKVYGDGAQSPKVYAREVKALEGAFIALSNKFGVAAEDVAGIGADWAAAGSSGKALAEQVNLTLQTMVLGEMNAKEATTALIGIQAQWGAVTEDVADKIDKNTGKVVRQGREHLSLTQILRQLNAVENETGTNMADLVTAYTKTSGAARIAGVSTGELAAMVAALVPSAGTASEAGNGLRTIIMRLMKPTGEAAAVLERMGVKLGDTSWQSKSVTERMKELAVRFQGLKQPQKAVAAGLLSGGWQLNKFAQLMEDVSKETGYFNKSLQLLADTDRVVAISEMELQKVLKSNPQLAKQAGTIIKNSLMKAMLPLIPIFIQAAQWLAKLTDAFASIPASIRTSIVFFGLALGVLGPIVIMMGLMKLSIGQLVPVFGFLAKAVLLPLRPFTFLLSAIWSLTLAIGVQMLSALRLFLPVMSGAGVMVMWFAKAVFFASRALALNWAIGIIAMVLRTRMAFLALPKIMAAGGAMMIAIQRATLGSMAAVQRAWAAASVAMHAAWAGAWALVQGFWATTMLTVQRATHASMLAVQVAWASGSTLLQKVWAATSVAIQEAWAAAMFLTQRLAAGVLLAMQAFGYAAQITLQRGWAVASIALQEIWAAGSLAVQKAHALMSLIVSGAMWSKMMAIAAMGSRGVLMIVSGFGKMLLALFASPWLLVIGIVVALIYLFRDQIATAFKGIVNYFRNLPPGIAKAFAPIGRIFQSIKNTIMRAFNALPAGVKGALLAVVRIVKQAAMKVYELFSYINPFAHHSPSLVENVTNGMAAVNAQFTNSAKIAQNSIARMHGAIQSLEGMGAGKLVAQEEKAKDADTIEDVKKAGGSNAIPAYRALQAEVARTKIQESQLSAVIKDQEAKLKGIQAGVKQYDNLLKDLNKSLDNTKAIQDMVGAQLDAAKARYEKFSNAQIAGSNAAEDATFANTMAQKQLQLQIAKLQDEAGGVDNLTNSFAKMQGQIEELQAKQKELRSAGAGSDILGAYDKMIADIRAQQSGVSGGSATGPAAEVAKLNTALEKLQKQAEIMDLEKALKFDPLNRKLDQFKSNVQEMPFDQIMNGLDSSKTSVDTLTMSYDALGMVVKGQEAQIAAVQKQRDALQDTYDLENDRLSQLNESYQLIEQTIRDGEEALDRFAQAAENAVQRQEEAIEKAKKKKGKKGEELSPGEQAFEDAGQGDFATYGGGSSIGREGDPNADQSGDINSFTDNLTKDLEEQLGGMNPFKPLMKAWDKTKDWFKNNFGGLEAPMSAMFSSVGNEIGSAFSPEKSSAVQKLVDVSKSLWGGLQDLWDITKKVAEVLWKLFGSDLMTTGKELWQGLVDVFKQVWGPLQDLVKSLGDLAREILPWLGGAVMSVIGVLEMLWEIVNGAIGPVFNWLGGIIRAIVQALNGLVKFIAGVFQVINGIIKVVIGFFKLFTGDTSMFTSGLSDIMGGMGKMLGGIVDIVKGIWTAIWSTIKDFVALIWNTVWGFVKGIIDFFTTLWDVLVGHSIVPDMINAIIDWFLKLPGEVLDGVGNFINDVIDWFGKLPGGVMEKVDEISDKLIDWFGKLPGVVGSAVWNAGTTVGRKAGDAILGGIEAIPGIAGKVSDKVKSALDAAPGLIIENAKTFGGKIVGWIVDGIKWTIENTVDIAGWIVEQMKKLPERIITFISEHDWSSDFLPMVESIGSWLTNAENWKTLAKVGGIIIGVLIGGIVLAALAIPATMLIIAGSIAYGLYSALMEKKEELQNNMGEWMRGIWQYLVDHINEWAAGLFDWFRNLPTRIRETLGDLAGELGRWVGGAFQHLVDMLPGWAQGPIKFMMELPGKILGALGNGATLLVEWGKNLIRGLLSGAGDILKDIGKFMAEKLPRFIRGPFEKAMGIQSPSKVFAQYGAYMGEGLIIGMDSMSPEIEKAADAMATAATSNAFSKMNVLAVADTSSVSAAADAMAATAQAGGSVSAPLAVSDDNMPDVDLSSAQAEINTFTANATTAVTTMSASISMALDGLAVQSVATFTNMNTLAVAQFTQMQTSTVTIVTTMVTLVNGQFQLLISYVTSFGDSFNAAWNAAWELWKTATTGGVDHTLSEWDRMALGLAGTMDNSIRPMFDEMSILLDKMEKDFSDTVNSVGATWDGIKEKTAAPARFVVNDVYNDGIRGAWNQFNKYLDLKELPEFKAKFREGGKVLGAGTGTSDSIYAKLSHGEHVITAREVRAAGGHQAVQQQRQAWLAASAPAFAGGGPVDLAAAPWAGGGGESNLKPAAILARRNVHKYWPEIATIGGYRASDPYPDHPSGLALDIMMPSAGASIGDDILSWLHAQMMPLALNYTIWKQFYKPAGGEGNLMEDRGSITQNHFDHIHALFNANGVPGIQDGGVGGGTAAVFDYRKMISEGIKSKMDEVRKRDPKIKGDIGAWPMKSIDVAQKKMEDFMLPKADKLGSASGPSGGSGNIAFNAGAGTEQWRKLATEMLILQGQSPNYTQRLLMQMNSESSGNPNAINLWDENAKRGTPSKGLMQVIDPTFQANRDPRLPNNIWDPAANIAASIRYSLGRYKTLDNAWQGHGYDNGGYLQPGIIGNFTGGVEPVLTQEQWKGVYTAASHANTLTPDDVESAMIAANVATGNTGDAVADAVVKGMDVWQAAWTPTMVDSVETSAKASTAVVKAADATTGATTMLSKSLGSYNEQLGAFSKLLMAVGNAVQSSIKVSVDSKGNATTTGGGSTVTKDAKGNPVVTFNAPTFESLTPVFDALGGLLDTIPYAERDWQADNPVQGETEQQRQMRVAQNNLVNFGKGTFNIVKDVAPSILKHVGIIGSAVEKLITQDGAAWTAALGMIASGNPAGIAILIPLILKTVATLLPLILNAILDIVPAIIRAIVRFLTKFMPDSVYAYSDMAAAEAAVKDQQENGNTAQGQGQRYPTTAMQTSSANAPVNLYIMGDLNMPNVTNGDDAQDFVDQLKLIATT